MKKRTIDYLKFFAIFTIVYIPISSCFKYVNELDGGYLSTLKNMYESFNIVIWLVSGMVGWLVFAVFYRVKNK